MGKEVEDRKVKCEIRHCLRPATWKIPIDWSLPVTVWKFRGSEAEYRYICDDHLAYFSDKEVEKMNPIKMEEMEQVKGINSVGEFY